MATYTFLGGDSFDDPNNWYNVTAGKPDDGVPGPNDTIGGSTAEIPAAGETVANAEGSTSKPVEIAGGLTITGEGSDLWLLFGGNFSIGTIEGGYIVMSNDTTVTAGGVDLNQPNNTGLSLDGTSSLTVTGSVVAQGDNIDTSGTFDVDGGVSVTNATLEIDGGVATVGGALALNSGSYLDLYQGSATVGSLNVAGSTVQVGSSSGATLKVTGDATVSSGSLSVLAGSTLTVVKTLAVGSSGDGALTLTGSGATMTAGSMEVGGAGAGTLTVKDGASLTIAGELQIGADGSVPGSVNLADTGSTLSVGGNLVIDSGSLTVDEDSTLAVTGDLLIGDDDATGSSADVTASPAATSIAGSVILKLDNATLRDDCVIGDNAKGTLTLHSNSTLNANHHDVTLGSQKTGNGQLIVDGGDAELVNIKSLIVGESGAGTMLIENHGFVRASTLYDGSRSSQGTGKITVSRSSLDASSADVGIDASGWLTVQKNGEVFIGSDLYVGAEGHITVSSNSGIAVDNQVGPDGSVVIGDGGHVVLDCASGAYDANTVINGGALTLERTGAIATTKGISFHGAGLLLLFSSKVTLSNTISGFGSGDTIQLDGVTATKPSYSNGTLTLLNGTAPVETLNVAGSYKTSNFGLTETGGNAVVTFKPSKGSAASVQEQISSSALLSDSLGHYAPEAIGERGSAIGSATTNLWSVGHGPGGW